MKHAVALMALAIGCGGPSKSRLSQPLSSAPSSDGLVVQARPLLGTSTVEDTVSIALRFRSTSGPIAPGYEHEGRTVRLRETLSTVVVEVRTPAGNLLRLRPDVDELSRSDIHTLVLRGGNTTVWTLGEAELRLRSNLSQRQREYVVPWQRLVAGLFAAAGQYEVVVRGVLVLGDRPNEDVVQKRANGRLAFATRSLPMIRRPADQRLVSLRQLHALALGAADRAGLAKGTRPRVSPLLQHRTIDRADGTRHVRLFASASDGGFVYEMTLEPNGTLTKQQRRMEGLAVAPRAAWASLMRSPD